MLSGRVSGYPDRSDGGSDLFEAPKTQATSKAHHQKQDARKSSGKRQTVHAFGSMASWLFGLASWLLGFLASWFMRFLLAFWLFASSAFPTLQAVKI